jgi:hypothetical protein
MVMNMVKKVFNGPDSLVETFLQKEFKSPIYSIYGNSSWGETDRTATPWCMPSN